MEEEEEEFIADLLESICHQRNFQIKDVFILRLQANNFDSLWDSVSHVVIIVIHVYSYSYNIAQGIIFFFDDRLSTKYKAEL